MVEVGVEVWVTGGVERKLIPREVSRAVLGFLERGVAWRGEARPGKAFNKLEIGNDQQPRKSMVSSGIWNNDG